VLQPMSFLKAGARFTWELGRKGRYVRRCLVRAMYLSASAVAV